MIEECRFRGQCEQEGSAITDTKDMEDKMRMEKGRDEL